MSSKLNSMALGPTLPSKICLLVLCLHMLHEVGGTAPSSILLALQAPITGIGQPSRDFRGWNATFMFAVQEINRRTDILPNTTIEVATFDTKCLALEAVQPSIEISGMLPGKQRAVAMIGDVCSDVSRMSASILPAFRIPQVSFGSSSPLLSDKTFFPYFMRVAPSDAFLAKAAASYIFDELGIRHVALIATRDSKSQDGILAFDREFTVVRNGTVLTTQLFNELDTANARDIDSQIRAIKSSGARVIVSYGKPDAIHQLYKSFIVMGMVGVPYVHITLEQNRFHEYVINDARNPATCGSLCDVESARKGLEGLLGFDKLNVPVSDSARVVYEAWAARLRAANIDPLQVYITFEYDAVYTIAHVLHEVIQAGGDVADGAALKAALLAFTHPGFTGTGSISFDANGDRPPQFLVQNFAPGWTEPTTVSFIIPNSQGVLQPQHLTGITWAGGRTLVPPSLPPSCPAGQQPVGWSDCDWIVAPAEEESSVGDWVNLGLAMIAVTIVAVMLAIAKRHSGSLLRALELLLQGVFSNVVGFIAELSDLISDVACAITILFLEDNGVYPRAMRVAYVAIVFAHVIPSLFNIWARLKNLVDGMAIIKFTATVQPAQSVDSVGDTVGTDTCTPTPTVSPNVTNELRNELHHVKKMAMKDALATRSLSVLLLALPFEDGAMSFMNSYMIWHARGNSDFVNSGLYALLAFAAVSSLINLGFKAGAIANWLINSRPAAIANTKRLHRLSALEKLLELGDLEDKTSLALVVSTAMRTYSDVSKK